MSRVTMRSVFTHHALWLAALLLWEKTHGEQTHDDIKDFLDMAATTPLGKHMLRLMAHVDHMEALDTENENMGGVEPDDMATIRCAAVNTMVVWYYG
jgi:hypothetical protein